MVSSRRRSTALFLPVLAVATAGAASLTAQASTPPEQQATVPAPGPTTTLTWKGTIPAGANPNPVTGGCSTDVATNDTHKITVSVPPGTYDAATTKATFSISWDNGDNDEIIQVDGPGGFSDTSDTAATTEAVDVTNPAAGDYTVTACPFTSTSAQQYVGTLKLTTTGGGAAAELPSSDAKGLAFSASVPSDPQRDVSEPLIEIDPSGRSYTCGPTGFSNFSDYSNTSDDGGDQFHLLGTQPRGQQGSGGGGDCGLGTGVQKNAQGNYQYAYAGLGPLTGFTTSTSPDDGKTLFTAGPQGNTNSAQGGGADRQWLTFLNDKDVLLNYNQQMPRNVVVQKSTDGGFSYITGNDTIAAGSPDFPGPMRSMPARLVDPNASADSRVAYFAWNTSDSDFGYVNLSISDTTGLKWTNCLAHKQKLTDGALQAFTVADNDNAGNIYIAYADEGSFHTHLTTLAHDDVKNCNEAVHPGTATTTGAPPSKDPGFSTPLQVDRDKVRTTIFPWLVAGGEPGRVALSYYGTESDGDPNPGSFKASWDVYVDQLTDAPIGAGDNAKVPTAAVGQVKATTHPIHYDSICLIGLNCDLSVPAGDRGLGDFFAIDVDPVTRKLQLVYNNTAKLPDAETGAIAAPMVVTQTGGPSNFDAGSIATGADRATVRTSAPDPTGDALVDYSFLNPTAPGTGRSGSQTPVKALDLLDEVVGPEVDPATGAEVKDGGFTVTMKLKDLSDAALQKALGTDSAGASLVYVFRFVNGYQPAGAVARWSPTSGFSFGFDDYTTASQPCFGTTGPKCEIYPGNTAIKGKVNQAKGTITLSVPRSALTPLKGTTGPGERPTEKAAGSAVPGDRFYDATAISFANPSPDPKTQGFMVNADNVRAMDFLLPGLTPAAPGTDTPTTSSSAAATTPPPPATSTTPSGGTTPSDDGTTPSKRTTPHVGARLPSKTRPLSQLRPTSARLKIVRATRRAGRLRITLRSTNGSVRGTTIRLTFKGRTVVRGTSRRVGSKSVTVSLRPVRGVRLRPGRYRLSVHATGASKARAGGVTRLR